MGTRTRMTKRESFRIDSPLILRLIDSEAIRYPSASLWLIYYYILRPPAGWDASSHAALQRQRSLGGGEYFIDEEGALPPPSAVAEQQRRALQTRLELYYAQAYEKRQKVDKVFTQDIIVTANLCPARRRDSAPRAWLSCL